ncbi:MAG TPA: S8 family serine peptidase [Actinocrinis sp.]|uniref:S8 family serine peptidase n=1 Tax=Actinocrinis sp. TaxID=1920516 RepID=UPI002D3E09A2|nr:S8 family serine peptidase [Actinocrinis sp.]HZU56929.1 S8 family serine peptidase [Actinocrinis sp.]
MAALLAVPVLAASPAHAYSSQQWALDYLKASQDWQVSKGANVTVAVLDSGVASISDLSGQVLSGADFANGTTSGGNGETDTDNDGHGTGMASVIAGNGTNVTGLAPSAKILPVRIDASSASGLFGPNIAAGIRYAVNQHVGVINLSIGGANDLGPDVSGAIAQAVAANIVVVAATGNQDNGTTTVQYPAAYPGVIAVGAIDQSGQIWSQSSYGARTTLAAPGVQIYRDNNFGQQGTSSGTSEATAYVSATAALIRSAHPDWTAGQVIRDLISTADPGSGQTAGQHSDQYGYGIIDPLKALQASAPSDTSNPLLGASGASATPGSGSVGNASSSPTAAASPSSSSHIGLIIGVVVGVFIVLGLALLIVALARRGRGGPKPPSGPGQHGGGYQPPNPQQNPYQQQSPYQQQNPYQQSPYQQQPPQYPQNPNQ